MGDARTDWPERLLAWYAAHARDLPWRARPPARADAYRVWLSEVMLQQTRVETVVPYFHRFLAAFPTVQALAEAPEQSVLKLWEGLGYYSRARQLRRAARAVVADHQGQLPETARELRALPGIGPYTAAAIASIAFGEPVPVVDGNVVRVACRYWGLARQAKDARLKAELAELLAPHFPGRPAGELNQALMELGATVCLPRNPRCDACPLAADCVARREGRASELPLRASKSPTPQFRVAAAVVRRGDRLLLGPRPPRGLLGGLWELPGGKCEPGEALADGLRRRLRAETGLVAPPALPEPVACVRHAFSHFRIEVHAFDLGELPGEPRPHPDGRQWAWLTRDEVAARPLATVTRRLLARIG